MINTIQRALFIALLPAALMACENKTQIVHTELPQIAEALKQARPSLESSCDQGFPGFLEQASLVISKIQGSDRFRDALETYLEADPVLLKNQLPEPGLLRLLLHQKLSICHGSRRDALIPRLEAAAASDEDRAIMLLLELLSEGPLGELAHIVDNDRGDARLLLVTLPATETASTSPPLSFLTCLKCRPESPVDGPRQIASVVTTLEMIASSKIALNRQIGLAICFDSSRKPRSCAFAPDDTPAGPTFALDGSSPLVVAWSAEVSWHLSLPHQNHPRRAPQRNANTKQPFVLDAGAEGTLDTLPAEAWMELFQRGTSPAELAEIIEGRSGMLAQTRPGSSYEVTTKAEGVRVTAKTTPYPSWEITKGHNSLWDLAALADELEVEDLHGGSIAAMLRVVKRFDGDSGGRRLGLHYSDPMGGSLLVAPSVLSVRDGSVLLGIRMYRPPGLMRGAFVSRLNDARQRLASAAGRPLTETERFVGLPSRVEPDSDLVRLTQNAHYEVSFSEPLEPAGSPRPGLGVIVPNAISIKLPTEGNRVAAMPGLSLLIELIWQIAINDVLAESPS